MGSGLSMASVNKIKELAESRDYSVAVDILDAQDLEKSLNPQFVRICGEVYENVGRYTDARKQYVRAHIMADGNSKVIQSLIILYLKRGFKELAQKYYEHYIFIEKASPRKIADIEYIMKKASGDLTDEMYETLFPYYRDNMDEEWSYELILLSIIMGKLDGFDILVSDYLATFKNSKRIENIEKAFGDREKAKEMFYIFSEEEKADDDPLEEEVRTLEAEQLEKDYFTRNPKEPEILLMVDDLQDDLTDKQKRKAERKNRKEFLKTLRKESEEKSGEEGSDENPDSETDEPEASAEDKDISAGENIKHSIKDFIKRKFRREEPETDDEADEGEEKTDKPAEGEKVEKPETAEKPEKVEKPEKAEKPETAEKTEKAEKVEKTEKAEKVEETEKVEKNEKEDDPEKPRKLKGLFKKKKVDSEETDETEESADKENAKTEKSDDKEAAVKAEKTAEKEETVKVEKPDEKQEVEPAVKEEPVKMVETSETEEKATDEVTVSDAVIETVTDSQDQIEVTKVETEGDMRELKPDTSIDDLISYDFDDGFAPESDTIAEIDDSPLDFSNPFDSINAYKKDEEEKKNSEIETTNKTFDDLRIELEINNVDDSTSLHEPEPEIRSSEEVRDAIEEEMTQTIETEVQDTVIEDEPEEVVEEIVDEPISETVEEVVAEVEETVEEPIAEVVEETVAEVEETVESSEPIAEVTEEVAESVEDSFPKFKSSLFPERETVEVKNEIDDVKKKESELDERLKKEAELQRQAEELLKSLGIDI